MAARGDPCGCAVHKCSNITSEPKYVRCRPCAIGNHFGGICDDFEQTQWQPDTCKSCGYDRIEHLSTKAVHKGT